ncbi:MAG: hypothetical protein L0Y57_02255 [Beijerinckiaceae bacterium]|nr:hypothetical protein [Beijerinckiaceae bacterium]
MKAMHYFTMPLLGAAAVLLPGCSGDSGPAAVIDYQQIGLCDTYTTAGGVRLAKPNEVFAVYKIGAVDNSKRDKDFNFLPGRLYVDWVSAKKQAEWKTGEPSSLSKPIGTPDWLGQRNSRRFVASDTAFAKSMGVRGATPVAVARAAKFDIDGYTIATVVFSGEEEKALADQTFFKLAYDRQEGDGELVPADPEIILTNSNAAQASWPHPRDCQELTQGARGS